MNRATRRKQGEQTTRKLMRMGDAFPGSYALAEEVNLMLNENPLDFNGKSAALLVVLSAMIAQGSDDPVYAYSQIIDLLKQMVVKFVEVDHEMKRTMN